jgi:hypothetical protein
LQLKGGQQLVTNRDIPPINSDLTVDQPATYCIRVVGYLDENWSARLAGLEIKPTEKEGKQGVTTLSGPIIDQAALFGVLKALYDMRLPLLSVECVEIK